MRPSDLRSGDAPSRPVHRSKGETCRSSTADIAGGNIRNIVLNAAFLAAGAAGPDTADLWPRARNMRSFERP